MVMNHLLLGLFWVLYGILHSVLAAPSVKAWAGKRLGSSFKLYRVFYTLVAFILFGLIILYAINMDSLPVFIRTSPLLIAGIIIGGSGVVLMIICIQKYFLTLSGLRSLFEEDVS